MATKLDRIRAKQELERRRSLDGHSRARQGEISERECFQALRGVGIKIERPGLPACGLAIRENLGDGSHRVAAPALELDGAYEASELAYEPAVFFIHADRIAPEAIAKVEGKSEDLLEWKRRRFAHPAAPDGIGHLLETLDALE